MARDSDGVEDGFAAVPFFHSPVHSNSSRPLRIDRKSRLLIQVLSGIPQVLVSKRMFKRKECGQFLG